jgi:hypothetical protein
MVGHATGWPIIIVARLLVFINNRRLLLLCSQRPRFITLGTLFVIENAMQSGALGDSLSGPNSSVPERPGMLQGGRAIIASVLPKVPGSLREES